MDVANSDLDLLPALFTYRDAVEAGLSRRRLYALRDAGLIEAVARGVLHTCLHRWTRSGPHLAEIALRAPAATLCLTSALVRHGLTDQNPAALDIAIPAGSHRPAMGIPVKWHRFNRRQFNMVGSTFANQPWRDHWYLRC